MKRRILSLLLAFVLVFMIASIGFAQKLGLLMVDAQCTIQDSPAPLLPMNSKLESLYQLH